MVLAEEPPLIESAAARLMIVMVQQSIDMKTVLAAQFGGTAPGQPLTPRFTAGSAALIPAAANSRRATPKVAAAVPLVAILVLIKLMSARFAAAAPPIAITVFAAFAPTIQRKLAMAIVMVISAEHKPVPAVIGELAPAILVQLGFIETLTETVMAILTMRC